MKTTMGWNQRTVKRSIALVAAVISQLAPLKAAAADGYWLDQYNALLFIGLMRLDPELAEMRQNGAKVVMVHADSLPNPILQFLAWRAKQAGLDPVAWIQRPTVENLKRVSATAGYSALQIDDHFFAKPPMEIRELRDQLKRRELWCSFQPSQYSWQASRLCDHVDIQIYRNGCHATIDTAYRLGVAGQRDTAIAVYHDGSKADDRRLNCFRRSFEDIGNRVFVFKWKNPEHWMKRYSQAIWRGLSMLRQTKLAG